MIKVIITKENAKIKHILISGHADFADYGKDIVCAGVSSIITTSVNAILSFKETIKVKDNENLEIEVLENDNITDTLLENMLNLLTDLAEKYQENISIKTKGK